MSGRWLAALVLALILGGALFGAGFLLGRATYGPWSMMGPGMMMGGPNLWGGWMLVGPGLLAVMLVVLVLALLIGLVIWPKGKSQDQ